MPLTPNVPHKPDSSMASASPPLDASHITSAPRHLLSLLVLTLEHLHLGFDAISYASRL